jgi:hypothetical protein
VYNIQKAVSRLEFAPKLKEIEVTDIQKGFGVFTPKSDKPVSFAALKETLKKAGYTLDSADITVAGTLAKIDTGWSIIVQGSGQKIFLAGPNVDQAIGSATAGSSIEITGDWKTVGTGPTAFETVSPPRKATVARNGRALFPTFAKVRFIAPLEVNNEATVEAAKPLAPIRVTSPGLTVYKGGAVTPRLYLVKQHLGDLDVNRQAFDVSVSYTPSPRLQLEVEIPFSRTSYDNGITSGSASDWVMSPAGPSIASSEK